MISKKKSAIKFVPFSLKQQQIMMWWMEGSPAKSHDGIICDGSIRAGKTLPMSLAFVEWAFDNFDQNNFAFCGKTIGALKRNVLRWLKPLLQDLGYRVDEQRTDNLWTVTKNGKINYFYYFGGRDESSQDLIQGITLAGILFDEVALMPESFVNQGTGRCSLDGAKMWFNCNPDSPSHWFKEEWLDKAREKRMLHLHFTMADNPSLSSKVRRRYESMYSGVFYKRFILGEWVQAEGAIYDMMIEDTFYEDDLPPHLLNNFKTSHYIGIDYGTQNACVFLHTIYDGLNVYIDGEYYYSGKKEQVQKTDYEYGQDFEDFTQTIPFTSIVIDPSAASFKAELRRRGQGPIKNAAGLFDPTARIDPKQKEPEQKNTRVITSGIRHVATMFKLGMLRINKKRCPNLVRELYSYVWDTNPTERGKELPLKKDDHGPDALRYVCTTIFKSRLLLEYASFNLKEVA